MNQHVRMWKRKNTVHSLRRRGQLFYNLCHFEVAKRLWRLASKVEHMVKMEEQPHAVIRF